VDLLENHFDTPVAADGRVRFEVPVYSRHCRPYLFGIVPLNKPTPVEERRVIQVLRDGRIVRKLSANEIARLPADAEGYSLLEIGP